MRPLLRTCPSGCPTSQAEPFRGALAPRAAHRRGLVGLLLRVLRGAASGGKAAMSTARNGGRIGGS
eukprot:13036231-Alexandrium_andersonii.AAC.1